MRHRTIPALAGILLLAACTGGTTEAAPEPSTVAEATTQEPTAPESVGTVSGTANLQAAYVAAGGDCDGELTDVNRVAAAVASGVCPGSGTVLSTYISKAEAEESLDLTMQIASRIDMAMILGDNWIVNPAGGDADKIDAIAEELGGQVIRSEATPVRSLDDAVSLDHAAEAYSEVDGAECSSPTSAGEEGDALVCEDGTVILEATEVMESEVVRQGVADALAGELASEGTEGTPVVGKRHIIVVRGDVDASTVASQVDGQAPSS